MKEIYIHTGTEQKKAILQQISFETKRFGFYPAHLLSVSLTCTATFKAYSSCFDHTQYHTTTTTTINLLNSAVKQRLPETNVETEVSTET